MSTIKEITCYQTEDGKVWTTLEQAEFWEKLFKKSAKIKVQPGTTYNFRNEGDSAGIDRYFGRGL